MNCQITNNSNMDMQELSPLIDDLFSSIQDTMNISSLPAVTLHDDPQNSKDILGKTAYYDPQNKVITVYVTNRHPKDIMRSLAHEMIHHSQNEKGQFDNIGNVGEGYAQSDDHLRNMEKEAYLKGNMCFRDWEDGYKNKLMESIHRQNSFKRRNNTMKIHKWKNNELNRLLMEKFNLGEGAYNRDSENPEAELKAKIKQAEDEGNKKKAEELRKQLQQMGGGMQEGELPQGLKDYNKKKSDKNRPMGALKKTLKDSGMSDEEIAKLSDDEIDDKAADIRLSKPQMDRNAKRMNDRNKKKTNESFRKEIRSLMEKIINK